MLLRERENNFIQRRKKSDPFEMVYQWWLRPGSPRCGPGRKPANIKYEQMVLRVFN